MTTPAAVAALRAQCLARGELGHALLAVERARNGSGSWHEAHAALTAATRSPLDASPAASLYLGAPAVAFALHIADGGTGRYARPLAELDVRIGTAIRRRLLRAYARIEAGQRPHTSEYDLFYGLTGLGMLLLERNPEGSLLQAVLAYLSRLTLPLPGDSYQLPGWWTPRDPSDRLSEAFLLGHLNLGMAHGIAGPMALMAAATRRGIKVGGMDDAIRRICDLLDKWRQDGSAGPWWPKWLTLREYLTGHLDQPGPSRPSWCYGTPGLACAQQLTGLALCDPERQHLGEQALRECLSDPAQLAQIRDATLCHGTAGILITTGHVARDAAPGAFTACLAQFRDLHRSLQPDLPHGGLLEGSSGAELANHCDTATGRTASGWDACLLPS